MKELLDRIRDRGRERDYVLDVLALWDVAKQAGYEPDDVKAFTFRREFLSREELREFVPRAGEYATKNEREYHNCVRLHNGELRAIPLTRMPIKTTPT